MSIFNHQKELPFGYVGRLNLNLGGADGMGKEFRLPFGSLVMVVGVERSKELNEIDPENPVRYTVVLLKRSGKRDPRDVSCDGVTSWMIDPEPGFIDWSDEDSRAADRQGWNIYWVYSNKYHPLEIQRTDGSEEDLTPSSTRHIPNRFQDDQDAWLFVWHGAVEHEDPLAQKALTFLYQRSPTEYDQIRKHCTGMALGKTRSPDEGCEP